MEKKDLQKILKIVAVFIIIIGVIVIFYYNKNYQANKTEECGEDQTCLDEYEKPVWTYIFLFGGFALGAFLIYKGNVLWSYIKKGKIKESDNKKIPEPLSEEEVKRILMDESVKNDLYFNEIDEVLPDKKVRIEEGCVVYSFKVKLLYPDGESGNIRNIIINANYPERGCAVLPEKSDYKIEKEMQSISSNVVEEEKPSEEKKTTIINPSSGVITETNEVKNPTREEELK